MFISKLKIRSACKTHLTGKTTKVKQHNKPKIMTNTSDGFTIGGFKTDRTNEFEEGMSTSELNLKLSLNIKIKS